MLRNIFTYVLQNVKCLRYGMLRYVTWGWKTGIDLRLQYCHGNREQLQQRGESGGGGEVCVCDCVLTRVAQIITATVTCLPLDLLMNSHHKSKTRSGWPSLRGLYVILENAYTCCHLS